MRPDIRDYNRRQSPSDRAICQLLAQEIERGLPEAESKLWHAHPVWFLEGNPIVGYGKLAGGVRLLFWSGQSFTAPGLAKEGKFKAAEARYQSADQVDTAKLRRWLAESRHVQWDYANVVRRKGRVERLNVDDTPKSQGRAAKARVKSALASNAATRRRAKPAKLLSGGNPQIAKGDGDALVQAYIAAMPGWKRRVGERLDASITRALPKVRKAVRWNSPFYGIEGRGWFVSFHVFTRHVKVAFFRGTSLRPVPPGPSKSKETRYLDLSEADELDEALFAKWVKQAAKLPGWEP